MSILDKIANALKPAIKEGIQEVMADDIQPAVTAALEPAMEEAILSAEQKMQRDRCNGVFMTPEESHAIAMARADSSHAE